METDPGGAAGRTVLLACGVLASLLYAAMNIIIPLQWEGYSPASQTVSELSAIGAPTRTLWVRLGIAFTLLYAAFGCGVLASAGRNRRLRVAGGLIVVHGILGLFWPPMHLRGMEPSLTDTLHIVWTVATVLLMLLAAGFAAGAFGKRFRVFSVTSLLVMFVFGGLSGLDGPRVAANLPTPRVGVWERINIAAFIVWLMVFAAMLLRMTVSRPAARRA